LNDILACCLHGLLHVFSQVHSTAVYTLPGGRRWTSPHLVRSLVVVIYTVDNWYILRRPGRSKRILKSCVTFKPGTHVRPHVRPRQVWVVWASWPWPNSRNTSTAFQRRQQPRVVQAKLAEKRLDHDVHVKIVIYQGSSGWRENFERIGQ
jgi:hypothetical protein